MLLFDLPTWFTGFNFLVGLFAFLLVGATALLTLMARGRNDASELQINRAIAAEGLVKTRDTELKEVRDRLKATETELEDLTAEHRTLAGITIAELLQFWAKKDSMEAEMADLKRQIRVLEKRKDGDA